MICLIFKAVSLWDTALAFGMGHGMLSFLGAVPIRFNHRTLLLGCKRCMRGIRKTFEIGEKWPYFVSPHDCPQRSLQAIRYNTMSCECHTTLRNGAVMCRAHSHLFAVKTPQNTVLGTPDNTSVWLACLHCLVKCALQALRGKNKCDISYTEAAISVMQVFTPCWTPACCFIPIVLPPCPTGGICIIVLQFGRLPAALDRHLYISSNMQKPLVPSMHLQGSRGWGRLCTRWRAWHVSILVYKVS